MNRSTYPVNGRAPSADLLAAALDYHRRGWSIVPMGMATKKPARKWKVYQTERANEAQLRAWFGNGIEYGIAVVFGDVSGGLASRDFDTMAAYERWASEHPEFASMLPTVATHRGRHVYAVAAPGIVEAIRAALGKPGIGAIAFTDGELRAGVGCYSVVPPSRHPKGGAYRWIIPPGERLPVVDLSAAGFLGELNAPTDPYPHTTDPYPHTTDPYPHTTDPYPHTTDPCPKSSLSSLLSPSSLCLSVDCAPEKAAQGSSVELPAFSLVDAVEASIRRTLPARPGERHRRLFDFARELKGIPALADAPLAALRLHVRKWHELALPFIATKEWEATWFDFGEGFGKVRHPAGQEPIALALARADAAGVPEVAMQYDGPELRRLVGLCRELQRTADNESFFLASRTGGALLGIHFTTVAGWLRGLCRDGILRVESAGDFSKHKASRYRYLAPF